MFIFRGPATEPRPMRAMSTVCLSVSMVTLLTTAPAQAQYRSTGPAEAQGTRRTVATLVYDAKLREVRCWSEGALDTDFREHLCDAGHGWHPFTATVYFVRGQSITLVLQHAVAEDLFALEVTADDLAEPQAPISGGLSELPKLQPIPPAPTIVPGIGAALVAGVAPLQASAAYRLAVAADEKDFKAWVQSNILDPLDSKEVQDLLALDLDSAIAQSAAANSLLTSINNLAAQVDGIAEAPGTMDAWIDSVKTLVRLIDTDSSLRTRLVLLGVTTAGSTVNSAFLSTRTPPVQRALAIDPADLASFANQLTVGFGDTPYATIAAIDVADKHFRSANPAMQPIIASLNAALNGQDATTVLARAKANLTILADDSPQIQLSDTRRQHLELIKTDVDAQRGSTTSGVYALQSAWTHASDLIVTKAAALNAAAKSLPLEAPFDSMPVGQWFTTKTISVTVKQGQRVALFDVGAVSDSTRAGIVGGDTPNGKPTQTSTADLSAARVIQFPVYNLYRYKIGLGFLYSTADDQAYRVEKVTGSGPAAVTEQYIDTTRNRDYTLLSSVNVMVFPWTRHAFPWRPRYQGEPRPKAYTNLAAMFGFSVTNPTRDFLVGGVWFPRMSEVGLQMAWHLALRDYPPASADLTQPLPDRVLVLTQKRVNGVSAGLVFTTEFFTKVFAPIFKP